MSVSTSTVIDNVKRVLNDVNLVHWTLEELLGYGSEGEVELVKLKPDAATKTTAMQLLPGARQTNPDGCIEILDMRRNVDGAAITPCDKAALDRFCPGWMQAPTGSAVLHYMDDPQPDTFYVYPAQGQSPAAVLITYTFVPEPLTQNGTLNVRDIYQADIENYILYRAFSKDTEAGNANRAVAYFQAFYGAPQA